MGLAVSLPVQAEVDVFDVLVRIVDALREDPVYGDRAAEGIAAAEQLLAVLKIKTGQRRISGSGAI